MGTDIATGSVMIPPTSDEYAASAGVGRSKLRRYPEIASAERKTGRRERGSHDCIWDEYAASDVGRVRPHTGERAVHSSSVD